jgi:methyl-accepting chemotaxis protein
VGQSLDIFDRVPSLQRNVLAGLSSSYTTDAVVGGARLRVTSNPVIGGDGKPLGTVLQWLDRTQEVTAEEEVKETVARAIEGDLTARLREEG